MNATVIISKEYLLFAKSRLPRLDMYTALGLLFTALFMTVLFFNSTIGLRLVLVTFIFVPATALFSAYRGLQNSKQIGVLSAVLNYVSLTISLLYFSVLLSLPIVIFGMYLMYTYILR